MELKRFKEKNPKKVGIILFTISCILLISGVILYRTFAIFQVNETQNMIEGNIQDEGDIRFMVYIDDVLQKDVPSKDSGYSLDTSTSYCENGDLISWNEERWSVELKNISTTKTKCYLKFKQIYKEEILNGAIPDLGNGRLIPVKISDTEKPSDVTEYTNAENNYGGKVTKADITEAWYSYQNKQWANAIILKDDKVDNYQPGDEILESDIESYFVWIPRYKYKLQDDEAILNSYNSTNDIGNQNSITEAYEAMKQTNSIGNKATSKFFEIRFESRSFKNNNLSSEKFIIHPAFVSFNSDGFWVGKFETGYLGAKNKEEMPNEINSSKVIIKPNVASWCNILPANAFYTSYEYQRDLESHMMKNSEWGAVAYLTNSQYGRCENNICEEVRINNTVLNITGFSKKTEPTCGFTNTLVSCNEYDETSDLTQDGTSAYSYYNTNSVLSSTTKNYSGIYDLSGGAQEIVMGVMQYSNSSSIPSSGANANFNSGFKGPYSSDSGTNDKGLEWPSSKYYDLYDYDTFILKYGIRGHLGDASKEMGPFFTVKYANLNYMRYVSSYNGDNANFVSAGAPWLRRGGNASDGTDAGIFNFMAGNGFLTSVDTFRIILTP